MLNPVFAGKGRDIDTRVPWLHGPREDSAGEPRIVEGGGRDQKRIEAGGPQPSRCGDHREVCVARANEGQSHAVMRGFRPHGVEVQQGAGVALGTGR